MANQIGATLDEIRANWNLQRAYLWEVALPLIGGSSANTEASKYCQEVEFSDYGMPEPSQMRYAAYQSFYAGFLSVQGIRLTFLKPIPDIVSSYFEAWKKLILDDYGHYFAKTNYAKDMNIRLLDNSGNQTVKFTLVKSFPTAFPEYRLSYQRSEILTVTFGLSCDRVLIEQ
jgi:hypothetical protein